MFLLWPLFAPWESRCSVLCLRTRKPSDPNSWSRGWWWDLCITWLFLRSCAFGFLTKNTLGPPLSWRWWLLPRPSRCSGGFKVFVRCFRKAAPSWTWHRLEMWRMKPPAGKMVSVNNQLTISSPLGGTARPPLTILGHQLLVGRFPSLLSYVPRIPFWSPPPVCGQLRFSFPLHAKIFLGVKFLAVWCWKRAVAGRGGRQHPPGCGGPRLAWPRSASSADEWARLKNLRPELHQMQD